MHAILFGIGANCEKILNNNIYIDNLNIVAFSDNNTSLWNQVHKGIAKIIPPTQIPNYSYDYVLVTPSTFYESIKQQLISIGIPEAKILRYDFFLLDKLKKKYEHTDNIEIQGMLTSFEKKGISVFGDFIDNTEELSPVHRDSNNNPYIIYHQKRMYFPPKYNFIVRDGKYYVRNIYMEQQKNSPHLYIKSEDDIPENAIIVDAGVCEGNFALKYIEKAAKIYLIESDPDWINALKLTFNPWQEKVVFCNKFLDRYDSKNTITLDSLVQENIDFLKMDIEGSEIDALLGGAEILQKSNASCAICSYHKQNDEKYIRLLLEHFGYQTTTSNGYMFFIYDSSIKDSLDMRRGIVYATPLLSKTENRDWL